MKRSRLGHLLLLLLVGSHLTQTIYYARMAVAALEERENDDRAADDVDGQAAYATTTGEPAPATAPVEG